jgi:tRNA(Ile)-lysidine synthase
MSITTPALLEVRAALRKYLESIPPHHIVLVGCSGGADSLALTRALFLEAPAFSLQLIPVVIDHDLQPGSAEVAAKTVAELKSWGIENIFSAKAQVLLTDGIEASARRARYQIFEQALETFSSSYFFLAHTQNDQAESVLLGLARGSGTKSLSGMANVNGKYIRPLLSISRASTEQACKESGIDYWSDPHNRNQKFTRVRVRENILPAMENDLGPGISEALARSAALLREDAEALDGWAAKEFAALDPANLDCQQLLELPKAIRSRLLRLAIYAAGAPAGGLTAEHLVPVEALITDWKGQGEVSLPGGVKVSRFSGRLSLSNP